VHGFGVVLLTGLRSHDHRDLPRRRSPSPHHDSSELQHYYSVHLLIIINTKEILLSLFQRK
jgi:hypothetical protein